MIKAVICDMFETLVTMYESETYTGRNICKDMGIDEKKFREIWDTTDEDRTKGRQTLEDVLERIMKENSIYSVELFNMIIDKRYKAETEYFEHLHPEIIPMFVKLKEIGIKTGLLTNCFFEERDVIVKSPLYEFFDVVCMSCELGLMKPEKEVFRICMDKLGVSPEECLYVGDGGSRELETAESLGMRPLQAVWYLKEGTHQPVGILDGFEHAQTPMDVCRVCFLSTL